VEFRDGSLLAQMSKPSMELPILYALTYPHRIESDNVKTNLLELPPLTFREVDFERYPLFKLALDTARVGGLMPTIMNAANEAAIELFSTNRLGFTEIYPLIDRTLSHFPNILEPDLETIIQFNSEAYNYALSLS
jgi:1-deoxy-D-xylulose-5-phosphate reductoisomerase